MRKHTQGIEEDERKIGEDGTKRGGREEQERRTRRGKNKEKMKIGGRTKEKRRKNGGRKGEDRRNRMEEESKSRGRRRQKGVRGPREEHQGTMTDYKRKYTNSENASMFTQVITIPTNSMKTTFMHKLQVLNMYFHFNK